MLGFEFLLGVYKSHILVVLLVVLEIASVVLDLVGETFGVLFSAYLLSVAGASITAYFLFSESPTTANLQEQQITWTDVLLAATQMISSSFLLTLKVLGHNKGCTVEFLFPLSFSILSAIFFFKKLCTTGSQTVSITSTLNEIRVDLVNPVDNLAVEFTPQLVEQNIANTSVGDLSTVDSQPVESSTPIEIESDHIAREVDGLPRRRRFRLGHKQIITKLEEKMRNKNIVFPMIGEVDDMCNYEPWRLCGRQLHFICF